MKQQNNDTMTMQLYKARYKSRYYKKYTTSNVYVFIPRPSNGYLYIVCARDLGLYEVKNAC